MNGLDIFYAALELLGGIGVFLFGMKLMGESLEIVAGNEIKKMFVKISDRKLIGVGIGAVTTAVVQSSAAVTVMAIGFVNSGLMSLMQATTIIYGANIGTTVTALIVALGYGGIQNLNLMAIFSALAGCGAFMILFSKKDKIRKIGGIIAGLGMIFVGLGVMNGSMKFFAEAEQIKSMLTGLTNPFLLLLFGILFTALIQSSSAISGIVITMTAAGLLNFNQALYIILGSNIGTCITSLIASIGTGTNAKRTAVVHLLFNLIGVTMFGVVSIWAPFAKMFGVFRSSAMQIAMLHTFFNVVTTVILLPFTKLLIKAVVKLVPERKAKEDDGTPHLYYLEERLLRTPPLAVAQLKNEVINMAEIAKSNFDRSLNEVISGKIDDIAEIQKNENILNFLNRELSKYLVKLSQADLSQGDKELLGTTYHTISDIERIGDYAENISEYAERMNKESLDFSDEAKVEIRTLWEAINSLYDNTMKSYKEATLEYIGEVNYYEDYVDRLKENMEDRHIERLNKGACSPEVGAIYLSLSSNAERVADHMTNIAYAVKSYAKPPKAKDVKELKG